MRELADAVGIRPASLYNHCASKQELLFTIAHGTMTELREGAEAAIAGQPDARGRLRAWVVWHVTYHARHRDRAKVTDGQFRALDAERLDAVLAARDAYERLVKGLIDDGVSAHGWVVPHRSVVTNAISTMCTAVDDWFREDGPLTADQVAAHLRRPRAGGARTGGTGVSELPATGGGRDHRRRARPAPRSPTTSLAWARPTWSCSSSTS